MSACVLYAYRLFLFPSYLERHHMQRASSTLLDLVQLHLKAARCLAEDLSRTIWSGKPTIFCRNEWPTYKVGWPKEGTFHLPIIYKVKV